MSKKINKNKQLSLRISSEIHSKLTTYANAHSLTLTDACVYLVEKGLKSEIEQPATKDDIEIIKLKIETLEANEVTRNTLLIDAIKNQPIAVQNQLEASKKDEEKSKGFFARLLNH